MTPQAKLQTLIERAIENGWKTEPLFSWIPEDYKALLDWWSEGDNYKAVIFNSDFAKSLWPEKDDGGRDLLAYHLNEPKRTKRYVWQFELQQAVISEEPISYMYKAVFGG